MTAAYRVTVVALDNGHVWEDIVWAECAEDARRDACLENIEVLYEDYIYIEEEGE